MLGVRMAHTVTHYLGDHVMVKQAVRRMLLTVLAVVWLTLSPASHAAVEILAEVS
jgi:hypothetical protein